MGEQKTILVIDDEPDLVEALTDLLDSEGFRVLKACNGQEGLKILANISPDLIILDMHMPQMSGIAFYQHIIDPKKGRSRYPILALTARSNLEPVFKEFHIDGFMTKPFKMDELLDQIRDILARPIV